MRAVEEGMLEKGLASRTPSRGRRRCFLGRDPSRMVGGLASVLALWRGRVGSQREEAVRSWAGLSPDPSIILSLSLSRRTASGGESGRHIIRFRSRFLRLFNSLPLVKYSSSSSKKYVPAGCLPAPYPLCPFSFDARLPGPPHGHSGPPCRSIRMPAWRV